MERHLTIVAALHIGLSIMGIIFVITMVVVIFGTDIFLHDTETLYLLSVIVPVIALFVLLLCALTIMGGIGLFFYKNWARILILIISAIDLFNIPVGTAIGIYSFWVLVQEDTVKLFQTEN